MEESPSSNSPKVQLTDAQLQRLILVKLNAAFSESVDESEDGQTDLSAPLPSWLVNMNSCGQERGYRECRNCEGLHPMLARCSNRWCMLCNWRVSVRRQNFLSEWVSHVKNPFHLVTTQRGFHENLRGKIGELRENMLAIRRQNVFRKVKGGCASIEFTRSEVHGWHMHTHWLVDCRFVPMRTLAKNWGKLCGQEFGIVHYTKTDAGDKFVREAAKYVVKGSELLQWTGQQIREAIEACHRKRLFGTFGSLSKLGPMIKADMRQKLESEPRISWECKECGCVDSDINFQSKIAKKHELHTVREEIKGYAGLR